MRRFLAAVAAVVLLGAVPAPSARAQMPSALGVNLDSWSEPLSNMGQVLGDATHIQNDFKKLRKFKIEYIALARARKRFSDPIEQRRFAKLDAQRLIAKDLRIQAARRTALGLGLIGHISSITGTSIRCGSAYGALRGIYGVGAAQVFGLVPFAAAFLARDGIRETLEPHGYDNIFDMLFDVVATGTAGRWNGAAARTCGDRDRCIQASLIATVGRFCGIPAHAGDDSRRVVGAVCRGDPAAVFPEFDQGDAVVGRRLVQVDVVARAARTKANGLPWDADDSGPDLALCFPGTPTQSGRELCVPPFKGGGFMPRVTCKNRFDCTFTGIPVTEGAFEVAGYDVDAIRHDPIGAATCAVGRPCTIGHVLQIQAMPHQRGRDGVPNTMEVEAPPRRPPPDLPPVEPTPPTDTGPLPLGPGGDPTPTPTVSPDRKTPPEGPRRLDPVAAATLWQRLERARWIADPAPEDRSGHVAYALVSTTSAKAAGLFDLTRRMKDRVTLRWLAYADPHDEAALNGAALLARDRSVADLERLLHGGAAPARTADRSLDQASLRAQAALAGIESALRQETGESIDTVMLLYPVADGAVVLRHPQDEATLRAAFAEMVPLP